MAHPIEHCRSSVRKWGGSENDYLPIHEWFDATKAWLGHSKHRLFRHHSEGIFVRYIGEQHVREDCNGKIPSAKEWIENLNDAPDWMRKTLNIND